MFQLKYGHQVKNTMPINKPHIGLSKYIFQKLNKPNALKNWEKTRKIWVNDARASLSKSKNVDVESELTPQYIKGAKTDL
jgi:hypothetical protein